MNKIKMPRKTVLRKHMSFLIVLLFITILGCGSSEANKETPPIVGECGLMPCPPPKPEPSPTPEPPPPPPVVLEDNAFSKCVGRIFGTELFLAASNFGVLNQQLDVFYSDAKLFAEKGICLLRLWPDWSVPNDSNRAIDKYGNIVPENFEKLKSILEIANYYGIYVDISLHRDGYSDFDSRKKAVYNIISLLSEYQSFVIFDLANEGDELGASYMDDLVDYANSLNSRVYITVSASGDIDNIIDFFVDMHNRGSRMDVLAPHFRRVEGWGKKEGELSNKVLKEVPLPNVVYNQEPAREQYQGQFWDIQEYLDGLDSAISVNSIAYVFHTSAGFFDTYQTGSWWTNLTLKEVEIVNQLSGKYLLLD
jgi:hypothetical protein